MVVYSIIIILLFIISIYHYLLYYSIETNSPRVESVAAPGILSWGPLVAFENLVVPKKVPIVDFFAFIGSV